MDPDVVARLRELKGLVATVVLTGTVEDAFSQCMSDMRSWCDRNGFHSIEWRKFQAQLVEAGRDNVLQHALNEGYDYVLQVDADAAPFQPNALAQLLHTAFITHPHADIVGAYCQLKGSHLPTIDTGTGTWEAHYPNEGVLPVIRTGAHFILVKPAVLRRFGPPWFRTRRTMRPIDALAEIDNYARIKEHGINALSKTETWKHLMEVAKKEGGGVSSAVGEDSGFCDAARAVGAEIVVDTSVWAGHIERRVITPEMLAEKMADRERNFRLAVGWYD